MHLLAGLHLGGATLTSLDDLAPGMARLGHAVLSPGELLRDLELRLGLAGGGRSEAPRLARFAARVVELAPRGRFYSRSHDVDPLGTAAFLLAQRDALVEAGWNGERIPGGGERLDALAELAALPEPELPPGAGDRLARIVQALGAASSAPYRRLDLADDASLWSLRWRQVFAALAELGTQIARFEHALPGAPEGTDLGRVQAALRGAPGAGAFSGDGSLVMLRAATSIEAAQAVAALVRKWGTSDLVVVRTGEEATLETALTAQGIPGQGVASRSRWRSVLQVLPLALELAFAPKDPERVLELVTLPVGPFQGVVGRALAAGLAEMPGIGGRAWVEAKTAAHAAYLETRMRRLVAEGESEDAARRRAAEAADARRTRIEEWLEQPGADPVAGASRRDLAAVVARVTQWLAGRRALAPDEPVLGAALGQAAAVAEALAHDRRNAIGLVELRQLVDAVAARGQILPHSAERAGRPDHVAGPDGLWCARGAVVWWHFVGGTERGPVRHAWRPGELRALEAAGLSFPDPRALLAAEAEAWRRTVLAATRRLVLVVPARALGAGLTPHPFWDELVARTEAGPADVARVTVHARELLRGEAGPLGRDGKLARTVLEPLPLPEGLPVWALPGISIAPRDGASASSLEALLGCPLQWVLRYPAGIKATGMTTLGGGPRLAGNLGHRLVELLHEAGALTLAPAELEVRAGEELDRMLPEEGATLLLAGMADERMQLREQLVTAVVALARALSDAKLTVVAVESPFEVSWRQAKLVGSIDLLLRDAKGRDLILDMKWGSTKYEALLAAGKALQLAVYAHARHLERGGAAWPPAGYFALSTGKLFSTEPAAFPGSDAVDGPGVAEIFRSAERTASLVEALLARGEVPVTGVRRALPLLEVARVPEADRADHFDKGLESACEYCDYDALCGRRWEQPS